MAFSNVQVLYQLSWEGRLEHPHMITVQYPSNQDGLRLRDVKKRLAALRGQGIGHSFSWSYKRNYRNTFIWNDLSDDDVIHPLHGSGEYLLKGSELIDTFANKVEPEGKFQKQVYDQSPDTRHSRKMSVDEDLKKDVVAIDHIPKSLSTLSVEQETIDMEKSDFCLSSSSDNEVSPRMPKMAIDCSTPAALVIMTKSKGLQTPPPCNSSPTELAPSSPGSARRLWKREIKKSLFRTRTTSSPSKRHEPIENAPEAENASVWKDNRSKSVNTLDIKGKEAEQSTSQLIRLLWARWTGGSSRCKRVPESANDAAPPCKAANTPESPCKEETISAILEEIKAMQEEVPLSPAPVAPSIPVPRTPELKKELDVTETESTPQELKMHRPTLIMPELQVVLDNPEVVSPGGGPPEAEIETPKPAIASADFKPSHGLPKVRTTVTSPRPLPPGFHKGTNDTKPVQTPRRNSFRNSIPLASPPLRRSLSRDAVRSLSAIGAISGSPDLSDSVASTPSPPKAVKKCINFHERDERPLTPGLTTLDWEKALQAAAAECLPPPNFREILQECSTCRRTFKPDSLEVHRRGCHPPQYARAFSARASPHMIRARAL